MRTSLAAPLAATALAALAIGAPAAMAGTSGAACSTSGMSYGSATDAVNFSWSLGTTLLQNGTARVQVMPVGGSTFTTLSTATVRTSGARATTASVATPSYLSAGQYVWRVQVTEWDGTTFSCNGPSFDVTRLPAPSLSFTGWGITADGWRIPTSGQSVNVFPAAGDTALATPMVRFQYVGGSWSTYRTAPAAIPSSDIVAIRAYRRAPNFMSGTTATVTVRKDTLAPDTPRPAARSVEVGPSGAGVGFAPSADSGSGTGYYESLVVNPDGEWGGWTTVSGFTARAQAGTEGGALLLRACDRVGNCSVPAEIALTEAEQAVPAPRRPGAPVGVPGLDGEVPADDGEGADGATGARRSARGAASARTTGVPRISALVPGSPRGGAARVSVELNRPAEVTFAIGGATIARAWLGTGRTEVRLPAQPRAQRALVTARPHAGAAAGEAVSATVSLPAGGRKASMAVGTTRMRAGATAVLYDMDDAVREVVQPLDGAAGLTHARGALRQEPSTSGLFAANDDDARMGKVTEEDLRGLTAQEIADVLREEIAASDSHLVAFDEVTSYEADPRSPLVRNGRIPAPDPTSPGAQLAQALISLDTPSPYGGTWASRVHVYIAPAVTSAMAAGRGPDRNLGRDGKARFRTYRTVMTGLARAGAVWIEAYHGRTSPLTSLTVTEWRTAPAAFTAEYRRAGGDPSKLHLLITGADAYPAGALPPSCITPMQCQWSLAGSTAAGRAMLANGVGAYRLGAHARAWLAEWQQRMP
ncbi:MAG: hypothetical protein FJW99_03540 [Actinobacteria bacterium]|nr:hypothetical protein [Actinomycetota bacterium]